MTGKSNKRQFQQYDKIIAENLERTLPVIITDVLKLDIAESEEIPDHIQHTKERKPDALKMVTDSTGNKYVVHVEFQDCLTYHYKLIRIADVDYKLFTKSASPEVCALAILADFGKDAADKVLETIVSKVQQNSNGEFSKERNFKHLRIFVQLRKNRESQLNSFIMQSVSTFFKKENDFLYKEGELKGVAKGMAINARAIVENLLEKHRFSDDLVADYARVSVEYVKQIREELNAK